MLVGIMVVGVVCGVVRVVIEVRRRVNFFFPASNAHIFTMLFQAKASSSSATYIVLQTCMSTCSSSTSCTTRKQSSRAATLCFYVYVYMQ